MKLSLNIKNGEKFRSIASIALGQSGSSYEPFQVGGTVHFPQSAYQGCPLRERCTTSQRGRSVSIHPASTLVKETLVRISGRRWSIETSFGRQFLAQTLVFLLRLLRPLN